MKILLLFLALIFTFACVSQDSIQLRIGVDPTGKIELWNETGQGYIHGDLVVVVNNVDYTFTTSVLDDSRYSYLFMRDFGFQEYEFRGEALFDVSVQFRDDEGTVLVEEFAVLYGLQEALPCHGAYFFGKYWTEREIENLEDVVYWNDKSGHYFLVRYDREDQLELQYLQLSIDGVRTHLHSEYFDKCEVDHAVVLDRKDFLKDVDSDQKAEYVFFVKDDCQGKSSKYNGTTYLLEEGLVYRLNGNTDSVLDLEVKCPSVELENEPILLELGEKAHRFFVGKY